jgi:hypothetical protein
MEKIWNGQDTGYVCPHLTVRPSNSLCLTEFKYEFENNYKKYKELNDKLGFFKKLKITIDYIKNNLEDFSVEAEYEEIKEINKNKLFEKIYRSSDYLSAKLVLNKDYVVEKDIYSLFIISEASNRNIKNKKLQNLFIENISEKYLDINGQSVLLTVPFQETEIVEVTENLNIQIVCLNKMQSDMYKFLLTKESETAINLFFKEFFINQFFDIGKIYKQNTNNETVLFYQNYLYLFNKDSIVSNAEQNDLIINDMKFNTYYPLLNKNLENKTICLSDDLNTDNIRDNNFNLQLEYLGYYSKDLSQIEDVAIDLDYFQSNNIMSAKIINTEEIEGTCFMSIEFITNLYSNEKLYIESSPNLKYIKRSKTLILDKEYITLLFKYNYTLDTLNDYLRDNQTLSKTQIISDKDLINFSAKLIL